MKLANSQQIRKVFRRELFRRMVAGKITIDQARAEMERRKAKRAARHPERAA